MENLVIFYPDGHQAHAAPGHVEQPERIEVVRRSLERAGWWAPFEKLAPLDLPLEFVSTVHDRRYLAELQSACQRSAFLDEDTYTTPASYRLAFNALGGAAAVAQAVWLSSAGQQPAQKLRGFVLGRPPGHHAGRAGGTGFCLANNIAVAAETLLSFPMPGIANARRLAIVDLDLHHGNGTQDIFWRRDDVLFISTHQSPLYPGSGDLNETGSGPGAGYTVNLPFPPGTGDQGYRAALEEIILPLLDRYRPEAVLVSLGFDPHWRDPLGHLLLSATGIGNLVKSLAEWADQNCRGRIVVVMEGGYDLPAVSASALATVAALLGESYEDGLGPSPRPEGKSWQSVLRQARRIWQL